METSLAHLPPEILYKICPQLETVDLVNMSESAKFLYQACYEELQKRAEPKRKALELEEIRIEQNLENISGVVTPDGKLHIKISKPGEDPDDRRGSKFRSCATLTVIDLLLIMHGIRESLLIPGIGNVTFEQMKKHVKSWFGRFKPIESLTPSQIRFIYAWTYQGVPPKALVCAALQVFLESKGKLRYGTLVFGRLA